MAKKSGSKSIANNSLPRKHKGSLRGCDSVSREEAFGRMCCNGVVSIYTDFSYWKGVHYCCSDEFTTVRCKIIWQMCFI